jgi:hypothetical protein
MISFNLTPPPGDRSFRYMNRPVGCPRGNSSPPRWTTLCLEGLGGTTGDAVRGPFARFDRRSSCWNRPRICCLDHLGRQLGGNIDMLKVREMTVNHSEKLVRPRGMESVCMIYYNRIKDGPANWTRSTRHGRFGRNIILLILLIASSSSSSSVDGDFYSRTSASESVGSSEPDAPFLALGGFSSLNLISLTHSFMMILLLLLMERSGWSDILAAI